MNKMVPEIFPRGIPTHETPPGKFPPRKFLPEIFPPIPLSFFT